MQDPLGIDPLAQTVELKIRPSQVSREFIRGLPHYIDTRIA